MATWQVTGQRQRPTVTPDGQFLDVIDVSFTLDTGEFGTVSISEAQYAPETVRARIQEFADKLAAVRNLTGEA